MATKGRRRDGRKHLNPRPDGRYLIRYKGQGFYGRTEDEAYARLDEYKRAEEAGEAVRLNPTVREYSTAWLPRAKVGIGEKTYNDYAGHIDKMNKVIGGIYVKQLVPSDIKEAWREYQGMSESTIRRARMLWIAVLDAAVADGIRRTNPARDRTAQPHRGTKGTHRAITQEERELIDRVQHRMRPMAMAMLYAGLRRGEALALDIGRDVDFERGVLTVREAVAYNGNIGEIHQGGKTEAAAREIPLLPALAQELKGKTGRLFKGENGEAATEQAFKRGWESYLGALGRELNGGIYKRWWGKTREQKEALARGEDIGDWREVQIRPHDLRHSYCVMLRDAGVDLKVAMRWMGHADEKMILQIYDHEEGRIQREREKLEAFTGQTGKRKVYRVKKGVKVKAG